jgi:Ca-activated chloride channel family protein
MEWQHPQWLYLILPLGAAWLGLALYSRRCRRRAAEAFVARAMWDRILPPDSPARFWWKTFLREVALVTGLVALAGPRFGTQFEDVVPRGSDLYVLIDVSRSMLADDVPPTRLDRAKADVAALVNRLNGERVGLIAFAGQAVVKCPLTVDYDAFRRTLDELDPGSAPRGGTAIGDAIRKALEVFHAKAERDQAILLITDGDDQQSYPLEAASVAAERHVTIFTVGLGDADRGARVPKDAASQTYVEYEGQQVWSKLNGSLLEEIALKTSGIYVPVGTRAYDLGELYVDHLQGRRGSATGEHKRVRRAEQFQLFLALSLFALLADLFTRPYPPITSGDGDQNSAIPASSPGADKSKKPRMAADIHSYLLIRAYPRHPRFKSSVMKASGSHPWYCHAIRGSFSFAATDESAVRFRRLLEAMKSLIQLQTALPIATALLLIGFAPGIIRGEDPNEAVRDGLRLYEQDDFDKAREKFSVAREEFEKEHAEKAAVAAFDEACAAHRQDDAENAREAYLKAGLSHDRSLAGAAHYNLGTLAAEEARSLAGEKPEFVAADKRQEILDKLKGAVASFRHSLELQPDNARARRDIELVRQWIKYYTEKWHERDRQKRRDESNLLAFLEFLIQTQTALRESVATLPATAPADAYAELKRAQDEIFEEIAPLQEKIESELRQQPAAGAPQGNSKELDEGISLLQSWAQTAGEKMTRAARQLANRRPSETRQAQQEAIDELEKIWEAIIPFQPLLARDLADQTQIASAFRPAAPHGDSKSANEKPDAEDKEEEDEPDPAQEKRPAGGGHPVLSAGGEDASRLLESQEKTIRRTQLLKLKAEAELERLEQSPPSEPAPANDAPPSDENPQSKSLDPEQMKRGFEKAIELAPQAVEQMQSAARSLMAKDLQSAFAPAEEARKILEEIQKAQPKNEPPPQKKDEEKKDDDQNKQDEKKEDQKKVQEDKQQEKKDQEKDQQPQANEKKQEQHVSRDRTEEALRKVRERQQEKRGRDRKMKARILGRQPVDKDW